MNALFQNKPLMLSLLGVVVAAFVWYGYLGNSNQPDELLTTEDIVSTGQADSDVVRVLLTLRAVSLAGTIFSDPAFMSLQDFGREITPEPVGRSNPFAPLGLQRPSSATTSAPVQ